MIVVYALVPFSVNKRICRHGEVHIIPQESAERVRTVAVYSYAVKPPILRISVTCVLIVKTYI